MTPPRKLLILDLDETLLFSSETPLPHREDFRLAEYCVYLRPHVRTFLEFCLSRFDVAVWTAATESYATAMVQVLFRPEEQLAFVWARSRCTRQMEHETRDELWLKDLKKVRRRGWSLNHVLAIDDKAVTYTRSYGNLVRVRPFQGDQDDTELLRLAAYLESLVESEDVRAIDKRGWRLEEPRGG